MIVKFALFVSIILISSCSNIEPVEHKNKNCALDSIYYDPIFTDVDLNKYSKIIVTQYKKADTLRVVKNKYTDRITSKTFESHAGKYWWFHLGKELNTNYDFDIGFVSNIDTLKFIVSDIVINEVTHYPQQISCDIVSYKVNGVLHKNIGNLQFLRR